MSQGALAQRAGASKVDLSRWENCERHMYVEAFLRVARALNVTPNDLLLPPDEAKFWWDGRATVEKRPMVKRPYRRRLTPPDKSD